MRSRSRKSAARSVVHGVRATATRLADWFRSRHRAGRRRAAVCRPRSRTQRQRLPPPPAVACRRWWSRRARSRRTCRTVPISINVFTQKDLSNLAITSMDDYLQKVPSISYISTGPGTQLFVMRGVSDGSNPNYANTSSTGFFVDDMSMSYGGAQPDLHLYDVERIEVLNGPQGTTVRCGRHVGRDPLHHQQARRERLQCRRRPRRRQDPGRPEQPDLRGIRQHPPHRRGSRLSASAFSVETADSSTTSW